MHMLFGKDQELIGLCVFIKMNMICKDIHTILRSIWFLDC